MGLRVSRCPGTVRKRRASLDDAARVALADVMLTVMPDRSVVGRALYEVQPDSGRLLTVRAPAGQHDPLVGRRAQSGRAAAIRAGEPGRSCSIPASQERVCLIWKTPPTGPSAATRDPGALAARVAPGRHRPVPGRWSRCPRRPAWRSRGSRRVSSRSRWPGWTRRGPTGWTSRSAMLLAKVDRSSGREHERLVAC